MYNIPAEKRKSFVMLFKQDKRNKNTLILKCTWLLWQFEEDFETNLVLGHGGMLDDADDFAEERFLPPSGHFDRW